MVRTADHPGGRAPDPYAALLSIAHSSSSVNVRAGAAEPARPLADGREPWGRRWQLVFLSRTLCHLVERDPTAGRAGGPFDRARLSCAAGEDPAFGSPLVHRPRSSLGWSGLNARRSTSAKMAALAGSNLRRMRPARHGSRVVDTRGFDFCMEGFLELGHKDISGMGSSLHSWRPRRNAFYWPPHVGREAFPKIDQGRCCPENSCHHRQRRVPTRRCFSLKGPE